MHSGRRLANLAVVLLCLLFLITGTAWVSQPGIQSDEALFGDGIYPPFDNRSTVRIFGKDYPTMIMTYVGSLKARLWAPIFTFWRPSGMSVRLPAVILACATIWLFFDLLRTTLGSRAGVIGAALLASDPLYLMTSRYDWGPVVLQHVCLVCAMVSLVRFHRERRPVWLAAGFFALGLGLWDKAIFIWFLAAGAVAVLVTFPRIVMSNLTIRNVAVATVAFCIGAFPFLRYNVRNDWITFRLSSGWTWPDVMGKAGVIKSTIQGDGLFGYIARENWQTPNPRPLTTAEQAIVRFSDLIGRPRRNLMLYLLGISVVLAPFAWSRPVRLAMLFSTVLLILVWIQMTAHRETGGSVHHTILMWPVHLIAPAAILAGFSRRFGNRSAAGVAVAVIASVVSNFGVSSTYLAHIVRNGGSNVWTEAFYPAADEMARMDVSVVSTYDWGFWSNMRMLTGGRYPTSHTPLDGASDSAEVFRYLMQDPRALFIGFVDGEEAVSGVNARLLQLAASCGYVPENRRVFADRNGRPVVQLFGFRPAGDPQRP